MEVREYVCGQLQTVLDVSISKKLEISIYNYSIQKAKAQKVPCNWSNRFFNMFYRNKARSLIYNLKHASSLVDKITSKTVKIQHVPYMAPWELWPEKYEDYFQKKLAKEMVNLKESQDMMNESGLFVCKKCKSDCTTYFSLQTRSADEPMTNYITCKKCGYKWKD